MKNKCYLKFFFVLCNLIITINYSIFSQTPSWEIAEQPFDPNVISQVPERGQFPVLTENLSVNHFTGQPNVEFPIYVVNEHDIQVPIALKYRTGGLRVDVEESYLGLNWDLVVGGEIRRTVVGLPDNFDNENVKGYPHLNQPITGYQNQNRKDFIDALKDYNHVFAPFSLDCNIVQLSSIYGQQYSDGRFDSGPDIYNFHIMGINGTFTGSSVGSYVENLQSSEWVNVKRSNADFTITDSKGYKYFFEEKEMHQYKYKIGYFGDFIEWKDKTTHKYDYAISWKLSKIEAPSGEMVSFFYTSHTNVDQNMENSKKNRISYSNLHIPAKCHHETNRIETSSQSGLFSDDINENKEKYIYKYLTSIVSNNTKVLFSYITEKSEDIPKLSNIKIYVGEQFNKLHKQFELNKGVFYKNNINSIKEYGEGNDFKEYKFTYYSKPSFNRFVSTQKDHWGFYSPEAKEFVSKLYTFDMGTVEGFRENPGLFGHRNPCNSNPNDGMLRQIIYPTGGSISFHWEYHDYSKHSVLLNQYSMTDGFFNGYEVPVSGSPPIVEEIKRELNRNNTSTSLQTYKNNASITVDLESYYPISGTHIHDDCSLIGTTFCRCVLGWDGNETDHPNEIPYIMITGPNNYSKRIDIKKSTVWKKHTVHLEAIGNYHCELVNAGKELIHKQPDLCYDFRENAMASESYEKVNISLINIKYPENHGTQRNNTYRTGGVRIKEIVLKSGKDQIRKLYNYALDPFDEKSPSSGVLTKAPRYGSFSKFCPLIYTCDDPIQIEWFDYNYTVSVNALPKSTEPTGHIEYSYVTEFVTNQQGQVVNNNLDSLAATHVISYEFWTSADNGMSDINETLNIRHVPNNQLMLTSMHFNRGHLKQKKEYTSEKKTTKYKYSILEKTNIDFIPATLFSIRDFSLNNACYHDQCDFNTQLCWYKDYGIVRYKIIPYNKRISEIEENGTLSQNYKKFHYRFSSYSEDRLADFPTAELTVNSKGDTIVNYYTYTIQNKLHTCVTVHNTKIIAAYRNEYDTKGNLSHKFIAEISPNSNLIASYYRVGEKLEIDENHPIVSLTNKCIESRVYEKNRLCEITYHQNNTSTILIWGYNGEYPIAEIKNLTLSQRNSLLNETQLNNLFLSYNPTDITIIDNLRNQLTESQITTYTYKMKVGVTSITNPRGITTYYEYDEFGWLTECYMIENNQKIIVQKQEYKWNLKG